LYKRVGNVPGGTYTEIGDILPIGSTYTPGYIILLDRGTQALVPAFPLITSPLVTDPAFTQDRSNWVNVIVFFANLSPGLGNQIQLLSKGCNTPNHDDISCFPSLATVNAAGTGYMLVNQTGAGSDDADTATYSPSGDNFVFHSGAPTPKVTKSFSAATIALNGATTMTVTINNTFPDQPLLSGINFTDTLPAGLVVATPNGLTNNCTGATIGATPGGSTVSLSNLTLNTGQTCTFSVSLIGTAAGVKNNAITRIGSTQRSTRGINATAAVTVAEAVVVPPTPVPPAIIPQVRQNPAALAAVQGIAGNGTRNNTPVPSVRPSAVDPAAVSSAPQLRPPSTGDAGLQAQ